MTGVNLVRSDLDNDNDISWFDIRNAITFPRNSILLALRATFIDLNGEFFPVSADLLTLAGFASLLHVDHLSLTFALVTWLGALRVHTWTHLSEDSSHTFTLAN
jgi:hypothetical protein